MIQSIKNTTRKERRMSFSIGMKAGTPPFHSEGQSDPLSSGNVDHRFPKAIHQIESALREIQLKENEEGEVGGTV